MLDWRPLLLCAALVASALSTSMPPSIGRAAESLPSVRIALQWSPQSQFAGFYMARAQGFYAEAGARVSLLHANAVHSSLDWLSEGKAELATAFLADAMVAVADAMQARSDAAAPDETGLNGTGANGSGLNDAGSNARPVLIGQLVRRSNLMLLAWQDLGITQLEDLDGRRVSLMSGPFSAAVRALLAERRIQPELIPQYGTVNLFLHRGVAACAAMEYNELHRIWQAGVDEDQLTMFLLRELGLDFPEDGLYARSDWLKDHDALAHRLWQATLKGWEYVRDHPEQALDLVLAEAERGGIAANRPHERWMLEHVLASIFIDGSNTSPAPGHLSASVYTATAEAVIAAGLLNAAPPFSLFCPGCREEGESSGMNDRPRPPSHATPRATPAESARASPDQTTERR